MKKILVVIMVLMFAFTIVACDNQVVVAEPNEVAALYDDGYAPLMRSMQDNTWIGIFEKDMSTEHVYMVKVKLTDAEYQKIDSANDSEDPGKVIQDVVTFVSEPIIEDVTSLIPNDEEMNQFVGKSLAEVEEMGFENIGETAYDVTLMYSYHGPVYAVSLVVNAEPREEISEEERLAFVVESVSFDGFSQAFFDERFAN